MTSEIDARIAQHVRAIEPQLIATRRDFHKHAETGWTEFRTASIVAHRLAGLGYEVRSGREVCVETERMGVPSIDVLESHWERAVSEGVDRAVLERMRGGFTGVVGELCAGNGPTIALRFDMDALPLSESLLETHRPAAEGFASIHPNVCHACGHDGHAAVGLAIAEILRGIRSDLRGTVRLIFQPAEEGVRGARSMVAAGVVDDVDMLLGHHLVTGCAVGEIFPGMSGYAATRKFDVSFHGAPSHAGGSPEGGHNALLAAATAALHLHALPRHRDGFTRVNVGQLTGGSGRNVIAAEATLVAEVRGETTQLCEAMHERAMRVVVAAADMHGCTATVHAMGAAGTADSDAELAERVRTIATRDLDAVAHQMHKNGGSEDFTEMMLRVQEHGGLATNIGIGADLHGVRFEDDDRERVLPAHTDVYDFDERALALVAHLLARVIRDAMAS